MTAQGSHFLRDLLVLLFAITAGLTLSGIIANIYRILARKPQSRGETASVRNPARRDDGSR